MKPLRRAFTLIELLIVVVIIGILAAIAIPKFSHSKGNSYVARMKSDLRNLAEAQEGYFAENDTYAANVATLAPNFAPSTGVTLTIVTATTGGWSATATSTNTPVTCALFYGAAVLAPATADGQIGCQ
jgi:type IV pilus assembly protein PilA